MKLFTLIVCFFALSVAAFAQAALSTRQADPVMDRAVDIHWRGASFDEVLDWLNELNINYFIDARIINQQREVVTQDGGSTIVTKPSFITLKAEKVKVSKVMEMIARAGMGRWEKEGDIYILSFVNSSGGFGSTMRAAPADVPILPSSAGVAVAVDTSPVPAISGEYVAARDSAPAMAISVSHAANQPRIFLSDAQWEIVKSRGFLKVSDLSKSQQTRMSKWISASKKGESKTYWANQGPVQIKRN